MRAALVSVLVSVLVCLVACGGPPPAPPPVEPPPAPPLPPPPPPPPERAGPLGSYHGIAWAHPSPTGNTLRGVAVLGANLVVMVGDRGTILRWDGASFALEDAPGRERLEAVWGDGPTRVFAVGESGTILARGESTDWTACASGTTATLHAIWGRGGDLFAVGEGGTILHGTGSGASWTAEPSGTDRAIVDVWGNATGVWALAVTPDTDEAHEAIVLARSATGWTPLSTIAADLRGLFVDEAGNFSLVGADGRHGAGTRWTRRAFPASRPHDAVFGAEGVVFAGGYEGRIARYDGDSWSDETVGTELDVLALDGTSATDVWAVGAHGLVAHLDGTTWSVLSAGPTANLEGVHGTSASDVWAIGHQVSLHWDGTSWSALGPADVEIEGIGGSAELFAVGDGGIIRHLVAGSWALEPSGVTAKLESVWSDPSGHAFAVGGGAFLERSGGVWSALSGRIVAHAVYGTSGADVWAVGDGAEHWDGTQWTPVVGVPVGHTYFGVWASGPNDVWVVGDGGTIAHFDGAAWTITPSDTTQDLLGVWGSSPSDVWAVGQHGTVVHWDGTAWDWRDSGTDALLHAVWGSGDGDVWMVGHGGVILHHVAVR